MAIGHPKSLITYNQVILPIYLFWPSLVLSLLLCIDPICKMNCEQILENFHSCQLNRALAEVGYKFCPKCIIHIFSLQPVRLIHEKAPYLLRIMCGTFNLCKTFRP